MSGKYPRHTYILFVGGSVRKIGAWSTIAPLAKHLADTGVDVIIRKVPDEE